MRRTGTVEEKEPLGEEVRLCYERSVCVVEVSCVIVRQPSSKSSTVQITWR